METWSWSFAGFAFSGDLSFLAPRDYFIYLFFSGLLLAAKLLGFCEELFLSGSVLLFKHGELPKKGNTHKKGTKKLLKTVSIWADSLPDAFLFLLSKNHQEWHPKKQQLYNHNTNKKNNPKNPIGFSGFFPFY